MRLPPEEFAHARRPDSELRITSVFSTWIDHHSALLSLIELIPGR